MSVAGHIKMMLESVPNNWKKILATGEMKPQLGRVMRQLQERIDSKGITPADIEKKGLGEFLRPAPEKIFEAFKYFEPEDLKVVIVGQDPYLKPSEAMGMSFSVPKGVKTPASLRNVYACWKRSGYLSEENTPDHGNLVNISSQGVLFINRYFTRSPAVKVSDTGARVTGNGNSKPEYLHEFWKEFTDALVKIITGEKFKKKFRLEKKVFVLLWGDKAKTLAREIGDNGVALFWKHPSPLANMEMNEENFQYCDHFEKVKQEYPEIEWNPDYVRDAREKNEEEKNLIVVYTDGSCNKNGEENAGGGYSVYFGKKFGGKYLTEIKKEFVIYGKMNQKTVRITNSGLVRYGSHDKPITSQRAELYAVIIAFEKILEMTKNRKTDEMPRVVLVSDNEYVIRCLVSFIWKKLREDKGLMTVNSNRDMVMVLHKQLAKLAKLYGIKEEGAAMGEELIGRKGYNNWARFLSTREKKPGLNLEWGVLGVMHQNAHKTFVSEDELEVDMWKGNNIADEYANRGREGNEVVVVEEI